VHRGDAAAEAAAVAAALPGERGMVDGRPCQDLCGTPRMHSRHTRAHTEQKS
jgi:hypothetical protein